MCWASHLSLEQLFSEAEASQLRGGQGLLNSLDRPVEALHLALQPAQVLEALKSIVFTRARSFLAQVFSSKETRKVFSKKNNYISEYLFYFSILHHWSFASSNRLKPIIIKEVLHLKIEGAWNILDQSQNAFIYYLVIYSFRNTMFLMASVQLKK